MQEFVDTVLMFFQQSAWITFFCIFGALYLLYVLRRARETFAASLGFLVGMTLYFSQEFSVPLWLPITDMLFQQLLAVVLAAGSIGVFLRILTPMYGNVVSVTGALLGGSVGAALFVERVLGISAVPELFIALTGSTLQLLWWATVMLFVVILFSLERKNY